MANDDFEKGKKRTLMLFGNPGVVVSCEGEAEETSLMVTCERLQVPHMHKKDPFGQWHCAIPQTLEELGM